MFSNIYFKSNLYIYTGKVGKAKIGGGGGVYIRGRRIFAWGLIFGKKRYNFLGASGAYICGGQFE